MNQSKFSLALRELREDFRNRNALIVMTAIGLVLGISGPFDTLREMTALPRIFYWLSIVLGSYAIGHLFSSLSQSYFVGIERWKRLTLSSLGIGVLIFLALTSLNALVFGIFPVSFTSAITSFGVVLTISAVVNISLNLLHRDTPSSTSSILDRVPLDKRGSLLALTAEDHYVEILTDKGASLVLMRLGDAMKEVGVPGLQVHRSHWIAKDQVVSARRDGDRAILVLSNGREIPVSRRYIPEIRAAGLLP